MKNKIQKLFGKRVVMGLLAILFIVGTVCVINVDGSQVLANNKVDPITLAEDIDYKLEKHSDISEYRKNGVTTAPELSDATIADKWIFAGWYQDEACKKALGSNVISGEAYAKFVSVDVLSVKCQISADTTPESEGTLIRSISSVDSLQYKQIGFEFVTPNGTLYMQSKKVGTRINAINEGNDCGYSPKVVDTESEYFFSAVYNMTKKEADSENGIAKEDFGTTYIVKPYWVTKDGTTVYGMSRCISVNEALTKQVIYIPVKMDEAPTDNHTLTANGTTLAYVDYDTDSQYAHFALSINTSLASATKYDIAGSDGNGNSVSTNYIYRNLGTKYRGEAKTNIDASFYEIYNTTGTAEDEYVIVTSMDLYGLRKIVNDGNNFVKKTVYVVCDIEVNKGKATSTSWDKTQALDGTEITDGTSYTWVRIGATSIMFAGTFDGQGHTISGIYYPGVTNDQGQGLFGATANTATIKNFSLTNSYFTAQNNYLGSIVGRADGGTFESIFSDAIINVNKLNVGGLIGRNEKAVTMKNCWFAGQLTNTQTHTGGLIGHVYADATITNCLNTGQIKAKTTVGGFFGNVKNGTVTLSHCLNNGKVTSTGGASFGAIAGNIDTSANGSVDCDYIYVEEASCGHIVNGSNELEEVAQVEDVTVVKKSTVTGVKALTTDTKSLFSYVIDEETYANESYWAIAPNGAPVLASFADVANAMPVDTSWYNASKSEFILSDAADLYGLALLSKTNTFENKKVKLGADITINQGTPDEWNTETPLHNWLSIGIAESNKRFAGTFDGQMHSINGIYLKATESNVGLFASTSSIATVKKLKIMNSSFETTKGAIGSVAGYGYGTFDTIYSDAYVEGGSFWIGGMIGQTHSASSITMNNCWFNGEVVQSGAGNASQKASVGGLLGLANNTVTIKNCLNTGSVTVAYNASTDPYVGGLIGRAAIDTSKKLTIQHCLNTGEVSFASMPTTGFGSIVGGVDDSTDGQNVIVENSYATSQSCWETVGTNNNWSEFDVTVVDGNTIGGESAKDKLSGLFDETLTTKWVVSAKHPVLEVFEEYAPTEKNVTALHEWLTSSASLTATLQNPITLPNPDGYTNDQIRRQGGYTDGEYFYQAYITYTDPGDEELNIPEESRNRVKVLKYDLTTGEAVWSKTEMELTHANDITYNSKLERFVVCHGSPNANKISYLKITEDDIVLEETVTLNGINIYDIAYNEAKDVYVAMGDNYKFYVLNSNFQKISQGVTVASDLQKNAWQGVTCDDDYIYFVLAENTQNNVFTRLIVVYDWSGKKVSTVTLDIKTSSTTFEPENISVVGNKIYIMVAELTASSKPANVYTIDLTKAE